MFNFIQIRDIKVWSGFFPDLAHIGEMNIKTRKMER